MLSGGGVALSEVMASTVLGESDVVASRWVDIPLLRLPWVLDTKFAAVAIVAAEILMARGGVVV